MTNVFLVNKNKNGMKEITLKDLELTPEWIIKAKYNSVLQVILDPHEWEQKYPLLEKIIDGLIITSPNK
ncbi:hypothetical protein A3F59_02650 [Candidatus Roizmanbacteria bacterium RIFCSPHIGHO2_12_FULL_38_13]|nr:MAG: hypothetical protein A3F59_02650 [Candidatus Roizmanbacteria bacterium RIFCSPHIGHO2_12_FULL_38_13]